MFDVEKPIVWWCAVISNQSQRIDTGSADVDWSSWSEEWSHDHDNQSQWTNEQLAPADSSWNHAADKSRQKSSASRNPAAKPAEKNLIDFDFFGESRDGEKVGTEAVEDGWDAEVWADVDDDNWEPLESLSPKSSGKRDWPSSSVIN